MRERERNGDTHRGHARRRARAQRKRGRSGRFDAAVSVSTAWLVDGLCSDGVRGEGRGRGPERAVRGRERQRVRDLCHGVRL